MDYVYGVLTAPSGDAELVVLPTERAEECAEIVSLLRSPTWGELRAKASPARYRELLCKAGYGEYAELAEHLPIGSAVREALASALSVFDPNAVPPGDGEPFDPHRVDVGGDDGYPPDPRVLQERFVPAEIVDRWGERYEAPPKPTCVMLRAEGLPEVIGLLEADGHTCREDTDLIRAGIPDRAA